MESSYTSLNYVKSVLDKIFTLHQCWLNHRKWVETFKLKKVDEGVLRLEVLFLNVMWAFMYHANCIGPDMHLQWVNYLGIVLHPLEDFGFDVKHALHCLHNIVNLGLYYPQNQDKILVDIIPCSGLLRYWPLVDIHNAKL